MRTEKQDLLCSVDGRVVEHLRAGDVVRVRRGQRTARLITLPGHDFFSLLRQKLHLRGSSIR